MSDIGRFMPTRGWVPEQTEVERLTERLDVAERERLALREETSRLKLDQSDWRKGVALIASALDCSDIPALCCVSLAEKALEIRADNDRLRAALDKVPALVRHSVENHCMHPACDGEVELERCACDDIMDDFMRDFTALAEGGGQ